MNQQVKTRFVKLADTNDDILEAVCELSAYQELIRRLSVGVPLILAMKGLQFALSDTKELLADQAEKVRLRAMHTLMIDEQIDKDHDEAIEIELNSKSCFPIYADVFEKKDVIH